MQEALDLLKESANEIKSLRRRLELQHARLQMFDDMMLIFCSEPRRYGQGETIDVAWKIDKFIEANKEKE